MAMIKQPKCFAKPGSKKRLLQQSLMMGASVLAISTGISVDAHGASCVPNITHIGPSASCTGPMNWTLGSGVLINNGTISGSAQGVVINGAGRTLDTLTNNGTLTATGYAIEVVNGGSIGTIINNGYMQSPSGVAIAIFNGGLMTGPLINTGTIFGGVIKSAPGELVIIGVTDGSSNFGTFTASGQTIENTVGGVRFAAGNTQVDMNMDVGLGQTVTNSGATLRFINNRNVNGNFSQTSGSLVFNALSANSFPRLNVSGTAALTGGNIVLVPVSGSDATGSYTIISAAGGVTSSVNAIATGYTVATNVAGNNLILTLTLATSGGSSGGTPVWTVRAEDAGGRAVPIGPVLDKLTADSNFTGLLATLSSLPTSSQMTALKQLGPSTVATQGLVAGSSFALSANAIGQRQMALLAGQSRGKAAGSGADGAGVWGQVLGNRASFNDAAGFRSSGYGLTLGSDVHLTPDMIVGGAFSWVHNNLTGQGDGSGTNSKLDSYQLAAYGLWRPNGDRLFLNTTLSAGRNSYSQGRTIDFLGSTARASYDGWQSLVKLGAGYDIPFDSRLTVTPLGSLQATRVVIDGYQESGAGVANLAVGKQSVNSVESELGVELTAYTDTSYGRLIGDWQTGWLHSFTNKAIATSSTLGGVSFVTTTDRLSKDGAHVVLRGTLQRTNNWSFSVEYDGNFRSNFRSQTATAKMRYDF